MAGPELSKPDRLERWREAMTQLRYLNDEVWKRFQFFALLELALLLLAGGSMSRRAMLAVIIFLLIGVFTGAVALYILRRNRIYYLQMLAKKSLLEEELGFYGEKFPGTDVDHSFPWRLGPDVVQRIKQNPEAWVDGSIRSKGTIARPLFWLTELMIALHALGLASVIYTIMRR